MYLQNLMKQNPNFAAGLLSGLSDASQGAAQMAQMQQAANQMMNQANAQLTAKQNQQMAETQQTAQQMAAQEEAKKKQLLNIGMMIATGGMGGAGEAATGGAGEAATADIAAAGADNAMAQVAADQYLKNKIAGGGLQQGLLSGVGYNRFKMPGIGF